MKIDTFGNVCFTVDKHMKHMKTHLQQVLGTGCVGCTQGYEKMLENTKKKKTHLYEEAYG